MNINDAFCSDIDKICGLINCSNYEINDLSINIFSINFVLRIFQKEMHDKRLSCELVFDDFSIDYESVKEAICRKKNYSIPINLNLTDDVEEFNNEFIHKIFLFVRDNGLDFNDFPPYWFIDAVNISYERYAKNFPDVAVSYKEKGFNLWAYWQAGGVEGVQNSVSPKKR